MTPDQFLNDALPWIGAVFLVVWVAWTLACLLFGKDQEDDDHGGS